VPLHIEGHVKRSIAERLTQRENPTQPLLALKDHYLINSRMQRNDAGACRLHQPGNMTRGIALFDSVHNGEAANHIPQSA
jgi:hypothetical protein